MDTMKMFQNGYRQTTTANTRKTTLITSRAMSEAVRFSLLFNMMLPPQNRAVLSSDALREMALAPMTSRKETTDLNRPTAVP